MRRFLSLSLGVLLLASIAVASSGGATQAEARWVITDLGTLGGDLSSSYVGSVSTYDIEVHGGINDRGQIAGEIVFSSTGVSAFAWEQGKMRAIGLGEVVAINDRGQVAGSIRKPLRAALWENGKTRNLGTLTGARAKYNHATALNDRGQVVGYESLAGDDPIWRGFLWQQGKMIDLGSLGGLDTHPYAINNRGQVVGTSWAGNETHGFLWENGKMTDLGPRFRLSTMGVGAINERGQIPGQVDERWAAVWENGLIRRLPSAKNIRSSIAIDISESGTVVGSCTVRPGPRVLPCLWRNGKVLVLDLAFGDSGKAHAVNDRGVVIGNSRAGRGTYHGFVWENGKMTDLGRGFAIAVNNRNQIIGQSGNAVLWTKR